MTRAAKLMTPKPQQQTLSVRINDTLRLRLERAKELIAARSGKPASTSDVAKHLLESAREHRLEVVELWGHPTETLLQIRRTGEAHYPLSRAEWAVLAHFLQQGVEALSSASVVSSLGWPVILRPSRRWNADVAPVAKSPQSPSTLPTGKFSSFSLAW